MKPANYPQSRLRVQWPSGYVGAARFAETGFGSLPSHLFPSYSDRLQGIPYSDFDTVNLNLRVVVT